MSAKRAICIIALTAVSLFACASSDTDVETTSVGRTETTLSQPVTGLNVPEANEPPDSEPPLTTGPVGPETTEAPVPATHAEPGDIEPGGIVALHYRVPRQPRGVPFALDVLGPDGRFTTRYGFISDAVESSPDAATVDLAVAQLSWPEPLINSVGPDRLQLPNDGHEFAGRICHLTVTEPAVPCVLVQVGDPDDSFISLCTSCSGVAPGMPLDERVAPMLAWPQGPGEVVLYIPTSFQINTQRIALQQFGGTTWNDVASMEVTSETRDGGAIRISVASPIPLTADQRICLPDSPEIACALVPPPPTSM